MKKKNATPQAPKPALTLPEQRTWLLERLRERLTDYVEADANNRAELAKHFSGPTPSKEVRGRSTTDLLSRSSLSGVAKTGFLAEIAQDILPEWDGEPALDLPARARIVSKRLQENLLSNRWRASSSCHFSNAVEMATANAASEFLRYGPNYLLERLAEVDAAILAKDAAEYAGANAQAEGVAP